MSRMNTVSEGRWTPSKPIWIGGKGRSRVWVGPIHLSATLLSAFVVPLCRGSTRHGRVKVGPSRRNDGAAQPDLTDECVRMCKCGHQGRYHDVMTEQPMGMYYCEGKGPSEGTTYEGPVVTTVKMEWPECEGTICLTEWPE